MSFLSAPETIRTGGLRCIAYNEGSAAAKGTFSGRVIRSWIAPVIDFTNINPGGVRDYYSIRCFGYMRPSISVYESVLGLRITTDDGTRLWIDTGSYRGYALDVWVDRDFPTTYEVYIGIPFYRWTPIIIEHYKGTGTERLLLQFIIRDALNVTSYERTVGSNELFYDTQLGFG